jgi:hypothetical protein
MTYTNGKTMNVSIQKISESELQQIVASARAARAKGIIVKPAADVPVACAAFSGEWTGTWGYGVGQQWLWVVGIDANCTAKFAYLSHARPPVGFATAEIKNGTLSFPCNRSAGTCNFKRRGDALDAWYSGAPEDRNNATFEKIQ